MKLSRVSKALYAGGSAAVTGFVIPAGAHSKLSIAWAIVVALGAGVVGFNATYWTPKNSGDSLLDKNPSL